MTHFSLGMITNPATGYSIDYGFVLDGTNDYSSYSVGSTGSRDTMTISCWPKRGALGTYNTIFSVSPVGNWGLLRFNSDDTITWALNGGAVILTTTAKFRDPADYMNIVAVMDLDNATQADRMRLYINGVRITAFGTETLPASTGTDSNFNLSGQTHYIGTVEWNSTERYSGGLAEFIELDDYASTDASEFGEFNEDTNQWVPIDPSGLTFGTNGFWQDYADNTHYGKDVNPSPTGSSYNDALSTGDRTSVITVSSSDFTLEQGTFATVVDGAEANNSSDAFVFDNSQAVSGNEILIDFGASNSPVVTEMQIVQHSANGQGYWTLYGSTDGATTAAISSSFEWGASATTTIDASGNSTAYRYLHLIGDSGNTTNTPWQHEFKFKTLGNSFADVSLTTASQLTDSPTINAGEGGNKCTINPLDIGSTITGPSNGNLTASGTAAQTSYVTFTHKLITGGKYYCENKATGGTSTNATFGLVKPGKTGIWATRTDDDDEVMVRRDGTLSSDFNTQESYDPSGSISSGTNLMFAINLVDDEFYIGDADTDLWSDGAGTFDQTFAASTPYDMPATGFDWELWARTWNSTCVYNFGATAYVGTKPDGYSNIDAGGLPEPAIPDPSAHFGIGLYVGVGTGGQSFTFGGNSECPADLLWFKSRDYSGNHFLFDSVRGIEKFISSDSSGVEINRSDSLISFDADGGTIGDNDPDNDLDYSGANYVCWGWKAGGAGSSNTDGSINTTATSVNTTAGFSISTYVGNNSAGDTVGHGLAEAPELIIFKNRDATNDWPVWHYDLDGGLGTKFVWLNTTAATSAATRMNNTPPTSTLVELGASSETNPGSSQKMVMYCFHSVPQFSLCGSFEGNASADGSFVNCGFKPAFVMVKNIDATGDWNIAYAHEPNVTNWGPWANLQNAESGGNVVDLVSNGFKLRASGAPNPANTHIFYAVAEAPIKYGRAQ